MGVMTAMPRTGEEWTVDDLDRLPPHRAHGLAKKQPTERMDA